MSFGIEVRDASGNLSLTVSARLLRYLGSFGFASIPARSAVNYTVTGLVQDGSYFAYTTTRDIIGIVSNGNIMLVNTSWITPSAGTAFLCAG